MNECWNCGANPQALLFCEACGVIQGPNPVASAFDVLGIDMTLELDESNLSSVYLQATRSVHPDFFAMASEGEKERSLQQSAAMNDAYRKLKSFEGRCREIVRALGLEGELVSWKPSPDLLMQVLEWNEELDACSGPDDENMHRIRREVEASRGETELRLRSLSMDSATCGSEWVKWAGRFQYLARLDARIEQAEKTK